MTRIFGLILLFWSTASWAVTNLDRGILTPVDLSQNHFNEISQDFPLVDVYLTEKKEILWFLGQNYLWRWNLDIQSLNRTSFETVKAKDEVFQAIGSDGIDIFAATNHALYQVQYAPFKVLRFLHPDTNGTTVGLFHQQDRFGWLHTSGNFFVDRYSKNLISLFNGKNVLAAGDKTFFDEKTSTIWRARQKDISSIDAKTGVVTALRTARDNVLGFGASFGDIFAYTPREVLKFSGSKFVVNQIIPSGGNKNIVFADFADDAHIYLFDDGSMESYHLPSKSTSVFRLPFKVTKPEVKLVRQGRIAAVLYDGKLYTFRISQ